MKVYRGDYYFQTFAAARAWAQENGWTDPAVRIRAYRRGWAVQMCISGPYAGPDETVWRGADWQNLAPV